MVAEAAHFSGQDRAAATTLAQLQSNPLRLEHTLIETELLRRRRATIVVDADVHPRVDRETARLMGWRSYAAAPLVVGSRVAGVIHADRGPGDPLDVLDRDVLWEFATGLAQAYESTQACAGPCATSATRCASFSTGSARARASSPMPR